MFLWKPILRMRANDIDFQSTSLELSEETHNMYNEIKECYLKLRKKLIDSDISEKSAPLILKEFLSLYLKSESFVISLFNEIFKPHFTETLNKRKSVFVLLNKLMKIFISIDYLRMTNPQVFCQYSFYKLHNGDKLYTICSEHEDYKLCILSLISLPMGRLMLSLFATDKFELFYPTALSKRMRINLNDDKKKSLYLYARLTEIQDYKYLSIYLGAIYKRFYGAGSYVFDNPPKGPLKKYLDQLQKHE
ncbi:hypothetical protein PAEPH01_1352 [Pancytospora epiphaga]|nr:hypothetical protein PAEPH01_1352 [Pancytospora epiphaga]